MNPGLFGMISSSLLRQRNSRPQALPLSCRCLRLSNKQLFYSSLPLLFFSLVWFSLVSPGNATPSPRAFVFPNSYPSSIVVSLFQFPASSILIEPTCYLYLCLLSSFFSVIFKPTKKGPFITLPTLFPSDSWLGCSSSTTINHSTRLSVHTFLHLD